jgi:hypothetical protein
MGDEDSVASQQPIHQACGLREVMGGIGHLIDHQHFCKGLKGPDAGLPYRLSALLVTVWVKFYGVEEASARSIASLHVPPSEHDQDHGGPPGSPP